jgi:hypothetical protein
MFNNALQSIMRLSLIHNESSRYVNRATLCTEPFKRRRQPINARNLARILRDYDVPTNNTIRINGGEPTKGYRREHFTDAWER